MHGTCRETCIGRCTGVSVAKGAIKLIVLIEKLIPSPITMVRQGMWRCISVSPVKLFLNAKLFTFTNLFKHKEKSIARDSVC